MQSCFSRMAAKLKNRHDGDITEHDIPDAEEDEAFSLTRATVNDQCQVADIQPVYFVCVEWFQNLNIALLRRTMCEHFDFDAGSISRSRKAPYITLLSSLVEVHSSKEMKFSGELPPPPPPPTPGRQKPCTLPSESIGSRVTGHR